MPPSAMDVGAWQAIRDPAVLIAVIGIVVTVLIAILLYGLLRRSVIGVVRRAGMDPAVEVMATRVLRWLFVPVVFLLVLQQAGIDLGNVWTLISTSFAMVAIGFVAVWSVLSNFTATAAIILLRYYRIGDDIEFLETSGIEGMRGRVVDLTLLHTIILEPDGFRTKVLNNIVFQKAVRIHFAAPASRSASNQEP